jgi:hypothetical protein
MNQPDFSARNKLDALVRERKDALSIRWIAATAAIGGYALIVSVVARDLPQPVSPVLSVLCWIAAAALCALSVVMPRRSLTDKQIARHLERPADPQRWAAVLRLSPGDSRTLAELPEEEQRVFGLTLAFERPYNVGLALAGALALVGLLYGVLVQGLIEAAPFLVAALALNGWHFPRLRPLIDRGLELAGDDEDAIARGTLAELKARESQRPQAPPRRPQPRLRRPQRPPPQKH